MKTYKFKATVTQEMLGTKPSSAKVFTDYIASKKADSLPEDEIDVAERTEKEIEALEKGMTIFHRAEDGKTPIIYDYELKGFLKDSIKALRRDHDTAAAKLKAYKSIVDGNIFFFPRMIPLVLPEGGEIGVCERPLRAQTAMGERVALAKSETVPAGTTFEFTVKVINPEYKKIIDECFEYAAIRGCGAWRSSGKGTLEIVEVKDESETTAKGKKAK